MPSFAELSEVAYKNERVRARRLAKQLGISEEDALEQVMQSASGAQLLSALLTQRRQEAEKVAAKIVAIKQAKAEARANKLSAAKPDPNAWLAWFDGASHPNPGKMGIGGLVKNPNGDIVSRFSYAVGLGDSSQAEYLALLAVLQAAVAAGATKLIVYGDSRVVLDDVQTKTAGAPALFKHRADAQQFIAQLNEVTFIWIPRRKNEMADALSQQAVKLAPSFSPP